MTLPLNHSPSVVMGLPVLFISVSNARICSHRLVVVRRVRCDRHMMDIYSKPSNIKEFDVALHLEKPECKLFRMSTRT